ncbi:IS21 family transposase [Rickettsia endosymbiont of Urophora cardui]|uniref:IS21 family transposase n=1 Tax=Rickettsia endosymbiont of Urophora cardui TaxID=3066265 RepID=UPI00313C8A10
MTCTNNQVGILMQKIKKYNQIISAAKAGMSVKTARKYLRINKYPSELRTIRKYRTRKDPFVKHWDEIESMLESAPELQATTILAYLTEKYHGNYNGKQLRCLQKRLKQWRAAHGKDKTVIFLQNILPGKQSQSDWTNMNQLGICIGGQPYPHLLFHFMLPYSCWETFSICHSESFDTLASGFEKAVWELGGVLPEHRTDNLSAATKQCGNSRQFTERWQELLGYYNVAPSRNNPGVSHENGSVEKSHDTFKQAVNQHLLLRGSRNFVDLKAYELFLTQIKEKRNSCRKEKLAEELVHLKELPIRKWNAPTILSVRVNPSSTVSILSVAYSVPSRLIGYTLKAYIYSEEIELYYGNKCLQKMSRISNGYVIDYRHIIDSLVRKPGAFVQYS